jgi:NADH-quinone oxidoreductase subunit G
LEAALRTAYEWITGEEGPALQFQDIRGLEGSKKATYKVKDMDLNVAVTNGLGNARKLLESIKNGESNYHIIEVMACPGGCIGGGGQPFIHGEIDKLKKRAEAIYKEDSNKKIRKSHENPYIKKIYDEYLGEPYGEKAHELLHTHYVDRKYGNINKV